MNPDFDMLSISKFLTFVEAVLYTYCAVLPVNLRLSGVKSADISISPSDITVPPFNLPENMLSPFILITPAFSVSFALMSPSTFSTAPSDTFSLPSDCVYPYDESILFCATVTLPEANREP